MTSEADHNEEVFIRDCIIWRETDPIFRTKIRFHSEKEEAQIHREIDHFFQQGREHPRSIQELPRAQPCQGCMHTGKGASIVVKLPEGGQYARD